MTVIKYDNELPCHPWRGLFRQVSENVAMAAERDPALDSGKVSDIVAAARELFGEHGYDKTTMREIAERANVALGTVYAHFGRGKAGVLDAVLEDRFQRLLAHVLAASHADPVDRFLDNTRRLNTELVNDPLLRKLQVERGRTNDLRLVRSGRVLRERFHALAVAKLTELDALGLINCPDPEAVAALLRVTTFGWLVSGDAEGSSLYVPHERVLETLLDAIRALITQPATK